MSKEINKTLIAGTEYDIRDSRFDSIPNQYGLIPNYNTIEEVNALTPKDGDVVLLKNIPIIYVDRVNDKSGKALSGWTTYLIAGYKLNAIIDDEKGLCNSESRESIEDDLAYVLANTNETLNHYDNGDRRLIVDNANILGATSIKALFSRNYVLGGGTTPSFSKIAAAKLGVISEPNGYCFVHNVRYWGTASMGHDGTAHIYEETKNKFITHRIKKSDKVFTNTKKIYFAADTYNDSDYQYVRYLERIGFDITKDNVVTYYDYVTNQSIDKSTVFTNFSCYVIADIVLGDVLETFEDSWSSTGVRYSESYKRCSPTIYLIQIKDISPS